MDLPTERDIRDHACMEALFEGTEQGTKQVTAAVLDGLFEDTEDARTWLNEARSDGLVRRAEKLHPSYALTQDGVRWVEQARANRDNRGKRRTACRRQLLGWTDQQSESTDDRTDTRRFEGKPAGWFCGHYFTTAEINAAAEHLGQSGLIVSRPIKSNKGVLFSTVAITDAGQECVEEYDGDSTAYLAAKVRTTPTYSFGNVTNSAFAIGHDNATVTATTTNIDVEAAVLLAQAAREALPVLRLTEQERAEAEQHLADIEQRDDPERVRSGLRWLGGFATNAAAGGLGQVLGMVAMGIVGG